MIERRALLRGLIAAIASLPLGPIRLWAQADRFEADHATLLKAIAAAVLPETLGRRGTDEIAEGFLRWIKNYRAGVPMDNGYGATHPHQTPPLPLDRYAQQLASLEQAAHDRRTPFGAMRVADARALIEASLHDAKIEQLPNRPSGQHIVADLMAFYFHSSEANDLCYRAAIRRFDCRGLAEAGDKPPAVAS